MSSINIKNEWGKLKEVIVGRVPDNTRFNSVTHSVNMVLDDELKKLEAQYAGEIIKDIIPDVFEIIKSQVQDLVNTYGDEGVKVYQARPLTNEEDQFLENLAVGGAPIYMRDPVLVIKNKIIELGLKTPFRRKEIFAIREILETKAREDHNVDYISMPQPLPVKPTMTSDGPGPFLEGGDIFIMDNDIFIGNSSLASNKAGINWLNNLLSPEGYTLHEVKLKNNIIHLDCILSIIKPGLCICSTEGLLNGMPEYFRDWEVIDATLEEAHALGCNTMCLDENKVLIGKEHSRLINELNKRDVDVISVQMDVVSKMGGGIRCLSHPLVRK